MHGIYNIDWPVHIRNKDVPFAARVHMSRGGSLESFFKWLDSVSLDIRLAPWDVGVEIFGAVRTLERDGLYISYSILEPLGEVLILWIDDKPPKLWPG